MSQSRARRFLLCSFLIGAGGSALAQAPVPGPPVDEQKPPVWNATPTRTIRLFPAGEIYPVYIADPHRPTNAVVSGFYARSRIPDTSSPRTSLAGGGHFGILRIDSSAPGGRSWQVSIDAGLDAMFDSQFKNDAIGWDGNYGLTLTTTTAASPLGFKVAALHVSSHLGDEVRGKDGPQAHQLHTGRAGARPVVEVSAPLAHVWRRRDGLP